MRKFLTLRSGILISKIFIAFTIAANISAFFMLYDKIKEHFILLLSVFSALILFSLLFYFTTSKIFKKILKNNIVLIKNDFSLILNQLTSLTEIINTFFYNMDNVLTNLFDSEKTNMVSKFTEQVTAFTNALNTQIKNINNEYFSKGTNNIQKFTEDLLELEFMTVKIKEFLHDNEQMFVDDIVRTKTIHEELIKKSAYFFYCLKISIPIINELSTSSNEYSIKMVKSIFDKFDNVSDYSLGIYKNTQEMTSGFMNEKDSNSLGFLLKEFNAVKNKVADFYTTMSDLKIVSENFLTNSIESLKKLGGTSAMIEDISEKIKVIAINVRIEASRMSSETGFKVLGKEISEFAEITSKSAKESVSMIKNTTNSIEHLKNDYTVRLNEVYDYLGLIKKSFLSFEGIINNSFNQIKSVVKFLDDFSNNINQRIKETVGMLQFHDLTTQESSHIISGIDYITETFFSLTGGLNIEEKISREEQKELAKEIFEKFNKIITTDNERKIIEKNALSMGIIIDDHSGILKNSKRIDEQTILF